MRQTINTTGSAAGNVAEYLGNLEMGKVKRYKNMEVIPLFSKEESTLDYIVLDDAMKRKTFKIEETGDVNQLNVYNNSNKDVLIIKGEYVVGGKQNRMVTSNALVKKRRKNKAVNLEVHCIEHGRWNTPGDFYSGKVTAAGMRHGVTKDLSGQRGQQDTWEKVSHSLHSTGAESATENFDEFYAHNKSGLEDYVKGFKHKKKQVGVVVAIIDMWGNKNFYVDTFDKPSTMKKHFGKIIESYAADAIKGQFIFEDPQTAKLIKKDPGNTQRQAMVFLEDLAVQPMNESGSKDLGKDVEITQYQVKPYGPHNASGCIPPWMSGSTNFKGSGLVYKDQVVYFGASKENQQPIRKLPGQPRPGPIRPLPIIMPDPGFEDPVIGVPRDPRRRGPRDPTYRFPPGGDPDKCYPCGPKDKELDRNDPSRYTCDDGRNFVPEGGHTFLRDIAAQREKDLEDIELPNADDRTFEKEHQPRKKGFGANIPEEWMGKTPKEIEELRKKESEEE